MWGFGINQIGSVGTGTSLGQILKRKITTQNCQISEVDIF